MVFYRLNCQEYRHNDDAKLHFGTQVQTWTPVILECVTTYGVASVLPIN